MGQDHGFPVYDMELEWELVGSGILDFTSRSAPIWLDARTIIGTHNSAKGLVRIELDDKKAKGIGIRVGLFLMRIIK